MRLVTLLPTAGLASPASRQPALPTFLVPHTIAAPTQPLTTANIQATMWLCGGGTPLCPAQLCTYTQHTLQNHVPISQVITRQ